MKACYPLKKMITTNSQHPNGDDNDDKFQDIKRI